MTHILVNIEYKQRVAILTDEKAGERMIQEWCNYNNHTLVKRPEMVVFPSTYIQKKDTSKLWDIHSYSNDGLQNTFSFFNQSNNDIVVEHSYHGYTGIGILKESHISIHTYPEQKCIHVDFFSCKQLNYNENIFFIEKYFDKPNTKKWKVEFIDRSL